MSFVGALLAMTMRQTLTIEAQLAEIERGSRSEIGVAIVSPSGRHFHRKGERFSLQSVMKLMVAMAALDEVDRGRWRRDQKFTFYRSDLSLSHQPLSDKLGKRNSMTVTLADCIELTVTQSCSAAGDFLIRKMGGEGKVNAFLRKRGIQGLSVDRQERDLQTQIGGLRWRSEFVDEAKIEAAYDRVPMHIQDAAYRKYTQDPRDTTTPEAMALLLEKLITGKLLSPSSTKYLMGVMERTAMGPDRLKVGVPKGWTLGHKTGTSSTHRGLAWATNDVGYARKEKDWVILVALVRGSRLDPDGRAALIRRVAEVGMSGW